MPTEKLPKSVLFVITRGDSIGGGQIHVRDFSLALKRKDITVYVALGTEGALTQQLSAAGIEYFVIPHLCRSINPLNDIFAIRELCKVIREKKPELVSCHTAKAGMVGRIASFLSKVPVIFTAHGWQFAEGISSIQKNIVLLVETVLSRMTRRIITVSKYDLELAFKYNLGTSKKIKLVHNGLPWIDPQHRKHLGPDDKCRLIMVARFQDQKDHRTLLLALSELKDLNWELDLVGDGPLMKEYQDLAKSLGIENKVLFHGQRLDVPELMKNANIFLLISHWEGFPRSIIEAMRAELPVVCSDVGGCAESVIHSETGYLVKRQDVNGLKEILGKLIGDPKKIWSLGHAGRKRYEEEFTFQHMFDKTLEVWNEVLKK